MRLLRLALLIGAALFIANSNPAIAETVRFRSATTPPTPLQKRLAAERGQPIDEHQGIELTGELFRPVGMGPFPAVVWMHGCLGRTFRERESALGELYTSLGYVLLLVDSFGPRGIADRCDLGAGVPVDRVMDAYGALLYLASLPFVDPDRVAIVGRSQGGEAALSAVALGGVETLFDRHFRAAIIYYARCDTSMAAASAPTLILIGELDTNTPASACQEMMKRRSGDGASIRLVIYPGTYHSFDSYRLRGRSEMAFGHRNEYNEAAANAAWEEELSALRHAFGR